MTVDKTTRDVVVARNDGIYYYGLHGRGPAYAFEGEKKSISIFKDYIALVSPSKTNILTRSAPLRAFGGGNQADDFFSTSGFTILHTDLKFIAHQESLSSDVKFIFMEWGDLFVFTLDGKVFWTVGLPKSLADHHRSSDTTKRQFSKSLRFSINAISTFLLSTSHRNLESTTLNKISSIANMATSCTRKETTTPPCSNILKLLTIPNHLKLSEKYVK